ncbi:hypothetical protein SteCoe_24822 [Stentor coeruleus]|uniref:CSN8/PSMD8/EIF3K domain-containing protein n=1 Tax=Stentor coeruleus TaxID=5963 RepID=A0A1R2BGL8_9CILI|nr:hypothetical protein SteCoe_24822 [Stentor coeruleus]
MEDIYKELANNINSGAAINISEYFRKFEEISLNSMPSRESLIFYLFSCYLTDHLIHAKMLWKRIPNSLKGPSELEKVWEIGKLLIKSEHSRVLNLINTHHWILSQHIILMLRKKLIEDTKKRISRSYSSLEVVQFAKYLDCDNNEAVNTAGRWGWEVKQGFVFPCNIERQVSRATEERDVRLISQIVGYLEQKYHIGIDD